LSNNHLNVKSDIWIQKWIDYSSKYGLGYVLSNKSYGVFFNDMTKIVLDQSSRFIEYIEKLNGEDQINRYNFTNYPKELQKKVLLLQHFKNYL